MRQLPQTALRDDLVEVFQTRQLAERGELVGGVVGKLLEVPY
jgi:hypothetical protein